MATLLGIRTHDNYRDIWYSTYPESQQATVQSGLKNLSMHFGLQNDGTSSIVRRGVCNYQNPDSPSGWTNLFDYPASIPAGEFHNFEITTDMLNRDMTISFTWLYQSPNNPQVWNVEGTYAFTVLYYNPNPPPDGDGDDGGTYPTQEECEAAGYFWYDNACHLSPSPNGDGDGINWGLVIVGIGAVSIGIGVIYYLWKK